MVSQYFSKEGLEKLKQEMEYRTEVLRKEIAARIKEAKELGDLSESAEYTEAKEAQSLNEGRIEELKRVLENAVIIGDHANSGKVSVGSQLKLKSKHGVQMFTIVGAAESDPQAGFISNESPLGSAFLGRKKREKVQVETPRGPVEYEIVEVK